MGKPILYEKVCYVQEWFRLERMLFPCLILQMGHTGRSQCSDHFAIMEEMGRSHCNLQTVSLFPINFGAINKLLFVLESGRRSRSDRTAAKFKR